MCVCVQKGSAFLQLSKKLDWVFFMTATLIKVAECTHLPAQWREFGQAHDLSNDDLFFLLKQTPCRLEQVHVKVLARRLQRALSEQAWEEALVYLCMFVRSNLAPAIRNKEMEQMMVEVARCAASLNRADAPAAAGSTTRLARVWLAQLLALNERKE